MESLPTLVRARFGLAFDGILAGESTANDAIGPKKKVAPSVKSPARLSPT